MTSITVRVEPALLTRARRRRINLSDAARQGIEDAIRSKEFREKSTWLAARAVKPVEPTNVTLRRIRDEE